MQYTPAATLFIFSGLPATGKSSLAKQLAKTLQAQWLRIDSIEQSLKDQGVKNIFDTGYQVAFALALDNLKLGLNVVADSSNPVEASRIAWREVALTAKCQYREIEVICSDETEHQRRVATRKVDVSNLKLPNWQEIQERDYHTWSPPIIQIDTAGKSIYQATEELVNKMKMS